MSKRVQVDIKENLYNNIKMYAEEDRRSTKAIIEIIIEKGADQLGIGKNSINNEENNPFK